MTAGSRPAERPGPHELEPTLVARASLPEPAAAPPVALYLHVPFCVSVCPYCDFVVYAGADTRGPRSRVASYVAAVEVELELRADALDEAWGGGRVPLASVYLGGGTPSLLDASVVGRLLGRIDGRFGIAADAEVTLEANPGPGDRGDLAGFAAAGVTRVSFGVQSLDERGLRVLGRRHSPGDAAEAVGLARSAGIASVSLDLLYDIPDVTVDQWAGTLDAALDLAPDHLSLYALTLDDPAAEGIAGADGDHLPASRGALRWRQRARTRQDDDRAADQYRLATKRLAGAGFRGYELSNWARPGHESRHNLAYWRRLPYEAVGPGAHAFDGRRRRWTAARLDAYLEALSPRDGVGPRLPGGGAEDIDASMARAEAAILALRLDTGLPRSATESGPLATPLGWALEQGLLEASGDGDAVSLTMTGRLLSNELFARLL